MRLIRPERDEFCKKGHRPQEDQNQYESRPDRSALTEPRVKDGKRMEIILSGLLPAAAAKGAGIPPEALFGAPPMLVMMSGA